MISPLPSCLLSPAGGLDLGLGLGQGRGLAVKVSRRLCGILGAPTRLREPNSGLCHRLLPTNRTMSSRPRCPRNPEGAAASRTACLLLLPRTISTRNQRTAAVPAAPSATPAQGRPGPCPSASLFRIHTLQLGSLWRASREHGCAERRGPGGLPPRTACGQRPPPPCRASATGGGRPGRSH